MLNVAEGTIKAARRERNRDAKWTRMYRVEAWIAQGGKCAYCHEPVARACATADHVDPLIGGGSTKRENIKATCASCNMTKGTMTEGAFLKLIKSPKPGDCIYIWLAWSRRRIWLRVERAQKRIMAMVS
jgi:5-methylcytosine-specific restriction endonuclease McrA